MRALVIGDTGGIGAAFKEAVSRRYPEAEIHGLSRRENGLDYLVPDTIPAAFGTLSGPFHLIFVATGVLAGAGHPPERTIRALEPAALSAQFAVNAIGPALVLKHALALMPREERSVFAALSARVGSIGDNRLGGWYSYRASKAALNQLVHTAAIEISRTHREAICVTLHPGTVETAFTADYQGRYKTVPPKTAADNLLGVIDGLTPADTGRFFDWSGAKVPW